MSNIADAFSVTALYNRIMKDCTESLMGVKSRGAFLMPEGGEQMPKRPLRPCAHPGCPNLCEGQFCEQHRVEERRKYDKYERSADINKNYGRAWKRIRDRYASEHPLCEMCLKEGRLTPVQEVHHILPVSKGGTHARDNLMSLCQSCHTKIHHDLGDR